MEGQRKPTAYFEMQVAVESSSRVKKRDERKRRERGNEIGGPAAIERDEGRRATGKGRRKMEGEMQAEGNKGNE